MDLFSQIIPKFDTLLNYSISYELLGIYSETTYISNNVYRYFHVIILGMHIINLVAM